MVACRTAVRECGVTWASGNVKGAGALDWQHEGQQSGNVEWQTTVREHRVTWA